MCVTRYLRERVCAHVALLNGNAGRHVGKRSDTRLLESRVPNVLEGRALGVGENEREDLVGVRLQERVDLLQVSLNSSTVEQKLAANQLAWIGGDELKWELTQSVWQKWRTPSLLYHENQHGYTSRSSNARTHVPELAASERQDRAGKECPPADQQRLENGDRQALLEGREERMIMVTDGRMDPR